MTVRTKLILANEQCPGDIVMLTAAVRDLHRSNPGRFLTDVRTPCRKIWEHNPYITPISDVDPEAKVIKCEYPLINQSNRGCHHFIHGFMRYLEDKLGVRIIPTEFKGDIHLSQKEKSWMSQIHEITGEDTRFWIIVAGGKTDYTIKWWGHERWQAVVDHFAGRLVFVQVGESGHHHPPLRGVIDLRGKTDMRQLIRLIYHSDGIICPVTSLMHLAAAVEYRRKPDGFRPCVVVAGGREPSQWEAYPGHQFLHTIGMLPCCASGGCWRSRTVPLGDGDKKDLPSALCSSVVGALPRCMHMIRVEDVVRSIEVYLDGCPWLEQKTESVIRAQAFYTNTLANVNTPKGKVPPKNMVEFRVAGMRRSGLHAIVNWLAGLYRQGVCFVNDVNHQDSVKVNHECDKLPSVDKSRRLRLNQDKEVLLHNYEECSISQMRESLLSAELRGDSEEVFEVLVLRDPYNMLASRLHAYRKDPSNLWTSELLSLGNRGIAGVMELWKCIAREFVSLEKDPKPGVMTINYNDWHASLDYRKAICDSLKVPLQDEAREHVSTYGFGSSFEGASFNGRASEMSVTDRWLKYQYDPLFIEAFMNDREVDDLSCAIFGDMGVKSALSTFEH